MSFTMMIFMHNAEKLYVGVNSDLMRLRWNSELKISTRLEFHIPAHLSWFLQFPAAVAWQCRRFLRAGHLPKLWRSRVPGLPCRGVHALPPQTRVLPESTSCLSPGDEVSGLLLLPTGPSAHWEAATGKPQGCWGHHSAQVCDMKGWPEYLGCDKGGWRKGELML